MRDCLKKQIHDTLRRQGYRLFRGEFSLTDSAIEHLRQAHAMAKKERIIGQIAFIRANNRLVHEHMIDGKDLDVCKISPRLILVSPNSREEKIFRWWNHVWWSVPYDKAYGRQIRYVIWDDYHNAAIGLIGLQSPILSWAPRDKYLNIPIPEKDYWINQSMSAQRLGALPPYNYILGGKLVAMLMTCDKVREDFRKKYSSKTTVMRNRVLPARLLFITTTGAFGKSSVYTRLKFNDEWLAKFIGYSNGFGSFHISNEIYEQLLDTLKGKGVDVKRGFGSGPSRKMRLIQKSMTDLGYKNGSFHGVQRAIYFFPFAKNLDDLISGQDCCARWYSRQQEELIAFWKSRWALPRIPHRKKLFEEFDRKRFIAKQMEEIIAHG